MRWSRTSRKGLRGGVNACEHCVLPRGDACVSPQLRAVVNNQGSVFDPLITYRNHRVLWKTRHHCSSGGESVSNLFPPQQPLVPVELASGNPSGSPAVRWVSVAIPATALCGDGNGPRGHGSDTAHSPTVVRIGGAALAQPSHLKTRLGEYHEPSIESLELSEKRARHPSR